MNLLSEKAVIVTGASRGIGAAAARLFADEGASIVVAARDDRALSVLVAEIIQSGGEAHAVVADVTDLAAVEQMVASAVDRYGRLDGAFNNAGEGHRPAPLGDLTVDDFDRTLALNLRGLFLCMRAELAELSSGGAIVNMTSSAGLTGAPGMGAYTAAKHGVVGLTKTAAIDYGPKGIRVNAVAPGPILTDGGIGAAPAEVQRQVAQMLPLQRLGTVVEVARVAAFLLSDAAAFVNGAVVPVDGGKLAGIG